MAQAIYEKFRTLADRLQTDIDNKLANRQENTPKRQREAGHARIDGYRFQRTQLVLRALANMHEKEDIPALLLGFKSKKDIHEAMRSKINQGAGYYDVPCEMGEPAIDSHEVKALWDLLEAPSEEEMKKRELKAKVNELKFSKIPGYFPTPIAVIDRMIDLADIYEHMNILEPSAGSGAIADRVREQHPTVNITVNEINPSLYSILQLKVENYNNLANADFLKFHEKLYYDRIIMNPPFEKLQDIDHVRKAYDHLKEGGTLVSIMSPGPFFRNDNKSNAFQAWFELVNGIKEELPDNSFKESGTGVNSVLVVLER